jgi:hypothetical protein
MYSFQASDSSSQAVNPLAGLLSGGFTFSPQRTYGGKGNTLTATPTATATLTPTQANSQGPGATPFADGLLGFGGGAALTSPAGASILLPVAIVGGAILLSLALRRK